MKSLHSAPTKDKKNRSIYFHGPEANSGIENNDFTLPVEAELSDKNHQKMIDFYKENPGDTQQLKDEYGVNTEEIALQEIMNEGGEGLSEKIFESEEAAMDALTEAGIGNVTKVHLYKGKINAVYSKEGALTGDLSKIDKNLQGINNVSDIAYYDNKAIMMISSPTGETLSGDLSSLHGDLSGIGNVRNVRIDNGKVSRVDSGGKSPALTGDLSGFHENLKGRTDVMSIHSYQNGRTEAVDWNSQDIDLSEKEVINSELKPICERSFEDYRFALDALEEAGIGNIDHSSIPIHSPKIGEISSNAYEKALTGDLSLFHPDLEGITNVRSVRVHGNGKIDGLWAAEGQTLDGISKFDSKLTNIENVGSVHFDNTGGFESVFAPHEKALTGDLSVFDAKLEDRTDVHCIRHLDGDLVALTLGNERIDLKSKAEIIAESTPLNERIFESEEAVIATLTEAGIGNITGASLYKGKIDFVFSRDEALSGDLSQIDKKLQGISNISGIKLNDVGEASWIDAPQGETFSGDLSVFNEKLNNLGNIRQIRNEEGFFSVKSGGARPAIAGDLSAFHKNLAGRTDIMEITTSSDGRVEAMDWNSQDVDLSATEIVNTELKPICERSFKDYRLALNALEEAGIGNIDHSSIPIHSPKIYEISSNAYEKALTGDLSLFQPELEGIANVRSVRVHGNGKIDGLWAAEGQTLEGISKFDSKLANIGNVGSVHFDETGSFESVFAPHEKALTGDLSVFDAKLTGRTDIHCVRHIDGNLVALTLGHEQIDLSETEK